MMHKAWSSIEEVPYCFSRSSVIFQGHTALKIVEFYPNWAFPDCNSSLNSPMAMKCCTKLETAKERCPIVFQGHPSNFKVTQDKTSPILTQIGRFRTIGRSQLSNPSDLPCYNILSKIVTRWPYLSYCHVILWYSHVSNSFKVHQVIPWTSSVIRSYTFQITRIFPTGQRVYIWRLCDTTWHHTSLWFTIKSGNQVLVIITGD